ncbi:MAG: 4-hydroxy-3-methylbut-2-enyl diphosphate reductase, partial [Tenericutes bacterium]|nr:4-hydroxy-3-methylbut-2-enyl diphosphate reductase [Mycoplasmatota bacterium]
MIYFPKNYGVCGGANKAISMAISLKDKYKNKNVYIYKEILHNPFVINDLNNKNIKCIDNLDVVTKDDILIIRAHGEPKETYEYLDKNGIKYFDATCINVINIHNIVKEKYSLGYKIIIIGKKTHPEVLGTNGWCNNEAIILETEDDIKNISNKHKYFVVCQTTISSETVTNLTRQLCKMNIDFEFKNTICKAQSSIADSSVELAKDMDLMIVIGGKESSNTKELFNACSRFTKSYYFSSLKDFYDFIKNENFTYKTKIGITGGASTPKKQIDEFKNLLEFVIYYKTKLKEFNKLLKKYNESFITYENQLVTKAIKKFNDMNCDGKCLRGCLIDLGYKLSCNNDNYSNALSIAYETFETSILIHDDIIDNATLRRGKQTIPNTYLNEYNDFNVKNDNTHNSLGICIGDLGFYYCFQIILDNYKNDKNLHKILTYYNDVVIKTIKGEIIDVETPFLEKYDKNHKHNSDDIMQIYKLKTSWYTIIGPFCLGMILGNQKKKDIKEFEQILEPLGIAFQIKDDILGIYSSKDILGKSVYSDIEEFKQTILYSYIKTERKDLINDLLKY